MSRAQEGARPRRGTPRGARRPSERETRMTMRIGAKVPNSGPLPERLGIGSMAAGARASRVRVALGQRPHRASLGDRLALSVRGRRPRHLGNRYAVLRCPYRAGADRPGDRACDDRDRGARPAVAPTGCLREAGRLDRRRQRRPTQARRRRRVARGGVRRAQRPLCGTGTEAGRMDRPRARLLDGQPASVAFRPLRAAGRGPLPAAAGSPGAAADRRPLRRRAPPCRDGG